MEGVSVVETMSDRACGDALMFSEVGGLVAFAGRG